ncbi:TldD/PmbA family protein [Methylosinus sporium]|uniref:TldD/PmbA family protein n=1 Tax=Methylosinus sporium TaxID=428 RepID=A0A2U1SRK8_METSR|nr:metallopeptidase TldD-related protein [Methylosinus sporium]PWB94223.1 TldD/PmbA family protein [Methylosinus sporium]
MFLTRDDALALADRLRASSRADSCSILIEGEEAQSLRFAGGGVTTNVAAARVSTRVESHIGGRVGSVSVGGLDREELARAVARSEEIARLLPEDPEFLPPLGAQNYLESARYDEATAALDLRFLTEATARVVAEGAERKVNMFGCAAAGRRFSALASSAGLFAYDQESFVDLSTTARHANDGWSGWAGARHFAVAHLDPAAIGRRAARKAARDEEPLDLEPGRYTVILEPTAVGELAQWLMWMLRARPADEGRSFFSRAGGGTKLGEALFGSDFSIRSDPRDATAPEAPFGEEGLAQEPRLWVEKGVLKSLARPRYWAQKTGLEAVPTAGNFTVAGGAASLEEMIRQTKRGILVTRFWYTNMVDPRSLLLTGLTRDGNFLVENGEIVAPARNMRFNDNLDGVFSRIAAIGASERVKTEMGGAAISAPPMLIEGFEFSSKSSGI